jgi:hypothetical protein
MTPPLVISEKTGSSFSGSGAGDNFSDKPTPVPSSPGSSGWEDSPKYAGESTGVLTPSPVSKKTARFTSDSGGLKLPYIPVPAPRMTPPSVIVGPMNQKPASPGRQAPRPIVRPTFPAKPSVKEQPPASDILEPRAVSAPIIIDESKPTTVGLKPYETSTPIPSSVEETKEKAAEKPADGYKKKPPREED